MYFMWIYIRFKPFLKKSCPKSVHWNHFYARNRIVGDPLKWARTNHKFLSLAYRNFKSISYSPVPHLTLGSPQSGCDILVDFLHCSFDWCLVKCRSQRLIYLCTSNLCTISNRFHISSSATFDSGEPPIWVSHPGRFSSLLFWLVPC